MVRMLRINVKITVHKIIHTEWLQFYKTTLNISKYENEANVNRCCPWMVESEWFLLWFCTSLYAFYIVSTL